MEKPFNVSAKFIDETTQLRNFIKKFKLISVWSNNWSLSEMTGISEFQKMSELKFIDEVSDGISIIETSSCWT